MIFINYNLTLHSVPIASLLSWSMIFDFCHHDEKYLALTSHQLLHETQITADHITEENGFSENADFIQELRTLPVEYSKNSSRSRRASCVSLFTTSYPLYLSPFTMAAPLSTVATIGYIAHSYALVM